MDIPLQLMGISNVDTIITIIIALAAFLLSIVNTWWILWRDRVRLQVVFNPASPMYNYSFEVRNLSYMSVTVPQATISLHRSKKKEILWKDPQPRIAKGLEGIGIAEVHHLLPLRMEPRTNMQIYFDASSGDHQLPLVNQLHDQGYGYVFVYTACGCVFRKKFTLLTPTDSTTGTRQQ